MLVTAMPSAQHLALWHIGHSSGGAGISHREAGHKAESMPPPRPGSNAASPELQTPSRGPRPAPYSFLRPEALLTRSPPTQTWQDGAATLACNLLSPPIHQAGGDRSGSQHRCGSCVLTTAPRVTQSS